MARDLVAALLEVESDSFDLEVTRTLPDSVTDRLATAEQTRDLARQMQARSTDRLALAVQELTHRGGMSVRDIGAEVEVSFQRVHQLLHRNGGEEPRG